MQNPFGPDPLRNFVPEGQEGKTSDNPRVEDVMAFVDSSSGGDLLAALASEALVHKMTHQAMDVLLKDKEFGAMLATLAKLMNQQALAVKQTATETPDSIRDAMDHIKNFDEMEISDQAKMVKVAMTYFLYEFLASMMGGPEAIHAMTDERLH